jgi:DNA replication protein DnaC
MSTLLLQQHESTYVKHNVTGRARVSPDKLGADLLFQIISERYERGSILMSTNRAYKHWPEIFNNDNTLTSALLDRVLHHAETCVVEGKSYRAKDHTPEA